jgi:hypothetical protein
MQLLVRTNTSPCQAQGVSVGRRPGPAPTPPRLRNVGEMLRSRVNLAFQRLILPLEFVESPVVT